MEYKIEFHPAALKEFCELDGSKKQTDLSAPNDAHLKSKNVISQANPCVKNCCYLHYIVLYYKSNVRYLWLQ